MYLHLLVIVQSHSCCFTTVSHTVCTFLFLSFHRTPSYHLSIFCCITVKWLSLWSEVQTCIWPSWCHCHSLSLASVKSRLVLLFWYRLTKVVLDKGPLNGCVCVCVCVCVRACVRACVRVWRAYLFLVSQFLISVDEIQSVTLTPYIKIKLFLS